MRRSPHGGPTRSSVLRTFSNNLAAFKATLGVAPQQSDFVYMFPTLQNAVDKLPPTQATVLALKQLAAAMTDMPEEMPGAGATGPGDSNIPAAYTYFGQFLDHDITFDNGGLGVEALADPNLLPLDSLTGLINGRTSHVDLDSVYAAPAEARNGDRMVIGETVRLNGTSRPVLKLAGKSSRNDLPRQGHNADKDFDRAALIGDPRNDENTVVAQMHVAFLKAHNSLIDDGMTFDDARRALILRYQTIVLRDFLGKVCDLAVINDVLQNGPRFWTPGLNASPAMPVEFSVAAYRFGHSMIRQKYDFNENFRDEFVATFKELFSFTALSGQIGQVVVNDGFDTLPENWIIEWERFLPLGPTAPQMARQIDPRLTDQLFILRNVLGEPEGHEFPAGSPAQQLAPMLAMRNLLRGYLFGLPTGQAVARLMGVAPLQGQAMIDALPTPALKTLAAPFADATPLWFYVLAEAGNPAGPNGRHLGTVGSRIVAETLWNLVKQAKISVLDGGDHSSFVDFSLSDLMRLAGRQDP